MNRTLVDLYNLMPSSIRNVAASARGYYLRSWRYGSETERLVEEILERESWSAEKWVDWQEERLTFVLNRAATQVPYYREQWASRRFRGDRASWDYIENWEILEKDFLRQNPLAFIADDCNTRYMFHNHTSGTTGKPLNLWESRSTLRKWYAFFEARCRHWYGVSRFDNWAMLGGQLVAPINQSRPPFWVWNSPLKQLYMSSYHLAPVFIPYYLDALKRYDITYLYGYSSALYSLAEEGLRLGRNDVKMAVVISNAEPLYSFQREIIGEFFQCPVRETYGMAEQVAVASECEAGQLHLWPEVGWVEIMNDDKNVEGFHSGDLICTGLLNGDMPLIRYRVGDRGHFKSTDCLCICSREMPVLASVDGRVDDVLYTSDGRPIGRLDPVFKGDLHIKEAQIIQETLDSVRIKYVPTIDFSQKDQHSIIERIQERMGSINVILDEVEKVEREKNGKFRAVISKVSKK